MGPTWGPSGGWQVPGGPHLGPMNFASWVGLELFGGFSIWKASHYCDVIMTTMVSRFTSLTVVYSIVYWDAYQRKHQSSALLAFVWGIHQWLVNSPHKGPVTRKMIPFDDVIMLTVMMPIRLSKCRVIRPFQHTMARLRDFMWFGRKISYCVVTRGPAGRGSINLFPLFIISQK